MNILQRIALVMTLLILSQLSPVSYAKKSVYVDFYHQVWQLVRENYYDPSFHGVNWKEYEHKYDKSIKNDKEAYFYTKLMLSSLEDPYTRLLEPSAYSDENAAINSKVVGIGINIQQSKKDGYIEITRVLEDSPAAQAGLKEGDKFLSIDSSSIVGLNCDQAAELIHGEEGSVLNAQILRGTDKIDIEVTRKKLIIHPVVAKIINNDIGYIQLSTFISSDAAEEFKEALQKLANTKGIILDLRSNPGGLLSNAFKIASMLIPHANIVTTISRCDTMSNYTTGQCLNNNPMVVLVDNESASASEILAGALKDNSRAVIVGTRTYGKGLVQEINQLPFGAAVHITVSKYLTPSGLDINKVGISPNFVVDSKTDQLTYAKECLNQQIAYKKTHSDNSNNLALNNNTMK